jgi:protein-disulfide isomerase
MKKTSKKNKSPLFLGIELACFLAVAAIIIYYSVGFASSIIPSSLKNTFLESEDVEKGSLRTVFVDSNVELVNSSLYSDERDSGSIKLAMKTDAVNISFVAVLKEDGTLKLMSEDARYEIKGDLLLRDAGTSLMDKVKAKLVFSDNLSRDKAVQPSSKSTPTSANAKALDTKAYENAVKKKLENIRLPKVAPPMAQEMAVTSSHTNSSAHSTVLTPVDDSCLIKFGGFNQPKMGYDADCNVLSKDAKKEQIKTLINGFPEEFFVKFEAENEQSEIFVFTDYTCGYCQKLHRNIDTFLENGVSVNYIFYPRAIGMQGQDSFAEEVVVNMASAWCSDNQQEAIHELYSKKSVKYAKCNKDDGKLDSPVRQHYILGMMFDISGTPLIVGGNGETTYGFRSVGTTLTRLKL